MNQVQGDAEASLNEALRANSQAGNTNVMQTLANQANRWVEKPTTGHSDDAQSYVIHQPTGNYQPLPTIIGQTATPVAFIQEDLPWIQENLSHAQNPKKSWDLVQHVIETRRRRELEEQQKALMEQQRKTLRNQELLAKVQLNQINQKKQPKPVATSTKQHSKAYLNERQQILNQLFGTDFFTRTEMEYPYEVDKNGNLVDDPNIARGIAIADWIVTGQFDHLKKTDWSSDDLEDIRNYVLPDKRFLSDEQWHQLKIAGQLHKILKENEANRHGRDDAKAFAQGLQVLVNANYDSKGYFNEEQFKKDLAFFSINQQGRNKQEQAIQLFSGYKESEAAEHLLGGKRLGALGWNEKYWDQGRLFEESRNGGVLLDQFNRPILINQAHHFSAFFLKSLEAKDPVSLKKLEIIALGDNPQDVSLSNVAIDLGQRINAGNLNWKDFPAQVYQKIRN